MSDELELIDLTAFDGPSVPCHLSLDPVWERLTVIEYGQVWDGQLDHEWVALEEDERTQFLLNPDLDDRVRAMLVHEPFDVEVYELGAEGLWAGPGFDVPVLGMNALYSGEVIAAVQGRFGRDEATADAAFFHGAVNEDDPERALDLWQLALEAGDMKARFGLGYTLYEAGRYRDAYDHLRVYTELTPHNAWAWCWLGKSCEELGDARGAVDAYRRALDLERIGGMETDALERLEELGVR